MLIMPLTIFFWITFIITLFYIALQLLGQNVIDIIIILIIIDIIILELNRRIEKTRISKEIELKLKKIESIEKVCHDIFNKLESPIKKEKDDINYLLEKMARKSLDIENKLNKISKTLVTAIASLDERVRNLEIPEEET